MNPRILLLLLFCINTWTALAQVEVGQPDTTSIDISDIAYVVPEKHPEFPGGKEALLQFLSANIHFPDSAKKTRVYGKVYIAFTVETDGSVSHALIAKGIGHGCDEEALRVVKLMPKWKPALLNGKPIAVKQSIPIVFNARNQDK